MTVAELIDLLKRMPQDWPVALTCEVTSGADYAHPATHVINMTTEQANKVVVIDGAYSNMKDQPNWVVEEYDNLWADEDEAAA